MANTASARKRIRQTEKRTIRNRARRSRVRTFLRKVEQAISGGDKAQAQDAFRSAQPELQRAVTKGVFHRNTVARKLSRLSARIKALGGAPPRRVRGRSAQCSPASVKPPCQSGTIVVGRAVAALSMTLRQRRSVDILSAMVLQSLLSIFGANAVMSTD